MKRALCTVENEAVDVCWYNVYSHQEGHLKIYQEYLTFITEHTVQGRNTLTDAAVSCLADRESWWLFTQVLNDAGRVEQPES